MPRLWDLTVPRWAQLCTAQVPWGPRLRSLVLDLCHLKAEGAPGLSFPEHGRQRPPLQETRGGLASTVSPGRACDAHPTHLAILALPWPSAWSLSLSFREATIGPRGKVPSALLSPIPGP